LPLLYRAFCTANIIFFHVCNSFNSLRYLEFT
jgi:hypothetical protein